MSKRFPLLCLSVATALIVTSCCQHDNVAPPTSANPEVMPAELTSERYLMGPDGQMMTAAAMIAAGLITASVAGEAAEYYFDKKRGNYEKVPTPYHSRYWKREKDKEGRVSYIIAPMYRNQVINGVKQYNHKVATTYRSSSSFKSASKSGTTRSIFGSSARASAAS